MKPVIYLILFMVITPHILSDIKNEDTRAWIGILALMAFFGLAAAFDDAKEDPVQHFELSKRTPIERLKDGLLTGTSIIWVPLIVGGFLLIGFLLLAAIVGGGH